MSKEPGKIKVLVVDDEPNIIISLDFLIRKAGYELFIARNGVEALETVRAYLPDIVLLDIMMPDVDGLEVCRIIKSDPELQHIHIVFLSAKSKTDDIKQGLALGADDYVTKPFSTKALMEKVKIIADKLSA